MLRDRHTAVAGGAGVADATSDRVAPSVHPTKTKEIAKRSENRHPATMGNSHAGADEWRKIDGVDRTPEIVQGIEFKGGINHF